MKYDRHGRLDRTDKAGNIPGRTGIHDRPEEADGRHSGGRENGYDSGQERQGRDIHSHGTSDRPTFILMEKLEHGREAAHSVRTAIRLSLPYRGDRVKTMTTDNGNGFPVHGKSRKQ